MARFTGATGGLRSFAQQGLARVACRVGQRLPEHYRTPNTDYAVEKALKDLTSAIFMRLDRLGVHLLPKHFYTPIPDYTWLRANRPYWDGPAEMTAIDWDLDEQLAWLRAVCAPFKDEVAGLESIDALSRSGVGPGFGPIDAQVLHCVMRAHAPRRVVEVGSGMSTVIMLAASDLNAREGRTATRITSVDPYPTQVLAQFGEIELIRDFVQRVPAETFAELAEGDLLFIDSSHAVKVGSDVVRLFLDVIPRLASGVLIHVHDISLPYIYPRAVLQDYFAWQETTLLLALMTGNPRLQPLASMSALHYDRMAELREILPDYRPQRNDAGMRAGDGVHAHFPDSFWIRVGGSGGS